jgi:hypothetical protein
MLNEELERKAFEAWVNDENGNDRAIKRGAGDSYELMQTHLYWLAWKARAKLSAAQDIDAKRFKLMREALQDIRNNTVER